LYDLLTLAERQHVFHERKPSLTALGKEAAVRVVYAAVLTSPSHQRLWRHATTSDGLDEGDLRAL
jgi:hypothetical protein